MIKYLTCVIFLLVTFESYTQSIPVKGKNFEGFVFPKEYRVFHGIPDGKCRYTPDSSDIFSAEKFLRDSIRFIVQEIKKQPDARKYLVTKRILRKYWRQYVGFLNKSNERIIWINFVWREKSMKSLYTKDVVLSCDGGIYYWNIFINIDTGEVFDMRVNGIT